MYTIMIIEDDPKIAGLLKSHIERYGDKAVLAEDFETIVQQFEQVRPRSGASGYQFTELRWFLLVPPDSYAVYMPDSVYLRSERKNGSGYGTGERGG